MALKTKSKCRFAFFNACVLIGFAHYPPGFVLASGAMSSMVAGDNPAEELSQSAPAQARGTWKVTGDLITARYYHTGTLLPNGQVLVAGGLGDRFVPLASAELYDPASGMWAAASRMTTKRARQTATLLPNGVVL